MQTKIALAALALSLLPTCVFADVNDAGTVNIPITHVNLYTSGVGYFERTGTVSGDAAQTILFPVDQVNDVLKSLVLLDSGGGSVLPVTYGALDPVSKQLQAFSVNIGDNPDQATLLSRMRGAPVTVTLQAVSGAAPSTVMGTIVSVETRTITLPNNQGTTQQSTLNLISDGNMQAIPLETVSGIQILDDKLKQELSQEMLVVAQGRDASKRPLTLRFAGNGRRNVLVGYVAQAPLWQTSYRLVLGKAPILQGWANVQNTSQDDWSGIHLTLVSGRPVSFIQDLYSPIYIDRPIVAPRVASAPGPQTYSGNLLDDEAIPQNSKKTYGLQPNNYLLTNGMPQELAAPAPITAIGGFGGGRRDIDGNLPISSGTLAKGVGMRGAQLGTALFSYDIRVPVTIPRQQSAMIPFVQTPVQAETVSIFNQSTLPDHPMAGVRLKNTSGLHLMGGPITVLDQSADSAGYVGDALIDDTEPNQTRLLSYAVDLGIDAATDNSTNSGEVASITIYDGILHIDRHYQQTTSYTFKNHTTHDRTVVVEHPNQGGDWSLLEPAKPTETTANLYRFDVPVKAGASEKFIVRESYPQEETDALMDTDLGTLVVYSQRGEESAQVKAALLEVITRRRAVAETQAKINHLQAQADAVAAGQERIRDNMKALQYTSALYKRYVGELNDQETQLDSLHGQIDTLNGQLAAQQADLNNYVAHLDLS